MNTERERFQEWLYSQKPAPWQRFNTADEVGFFVWQHQAATIADLQQQLTEATADIHRYRDSLTALESANHVLTERLTEANRREEDITRRPFSSMSHISLYA